MDTAQLEGLLRAVRRFQPAAIAWHVAAAIFNIAVVVGVVPSAAKISRSPR